MYSVFTQEGEKVFAGVMCTEIGDCGWPLRLAIAALGDAIKEYGDGRRLVE